MKFDTMVSLRLDARTLRLVAQEQKRLERRRPGFTRAMLIREAIVFWLEKKERSSS